MGSTGVLQTVIDTLERAEWDHHIVEGGCFDLFASGDENSLVMKVTKNVDSAERRDSEEMKQASKFLGSAPVIVGERNSRGELERQVIYERYGIPTVSTGTLRSYIELQESSIVMNKKGGYYVSIDSERFEERRREEDYSINGLAKEIGVSSRTIRNYREGGAAAVEKAKRLEEVLGNVFREIDIRERRIEVRSRPNNVISRRLVKIGFDASGFENAPFDAGARDGEESFVGKEERKELEGPVLEFLVQVRELSRSNSFVVTEEERDYGELGSVSRDRLRRMDDVEDFKEEILF